MGKIGKVTGAEVTTAALGHRVVVAGFRISLFRVRQVHVCPDGILGSIVILLTLSLLISAVPV